MSWKKFDVHQMLKEKILFRRIMLKYSRISHKEEYIVNKTELITSVAERAEITKKEAEKAINAFLASVEEVLVKKEKVQLIGFGTFEVKRREARKGRNPQTGKEIAIPASTVPVFKAGKGLKDSVNK